MARLPTPGGDDGTWGTVLNDYLSQSLNTDGTLKSAAIPDASVTPSKLSQAYVPSSEKGAVSGVATLDVTGKVPSAQLPDPGITVQDENGSAITGVTQLDFQGAGVSAASGTGEVVVTIPGTDVETIRDTVAGFIQAGSGITVTHNDAADTLTIAASGGGSGSAFSCIAKTSAAVAIPDATQTTFSFDAEDIDTASMHDTVTGNSRITIPAGGGGTYMIVGTASFNYSAAGLRSVSLLKNGVSLASGGGQSPNATGSSTVTRVEQLAAGDYFELQGYQDSGAALNATGRLAVVLVNGNAGAPDTGVRVSLSADVAIPTGTTTFLSWGTEVFDTDNFHDNVISPSRLTVPAGKAGYYLVVARVFLHQTTSASYRQQLGVLVNGVSKAYSASTSNTASGNGASCVVSEILYLNAADYVEMNVWHAAGASRNVEADPDHTSLSLIRLGSGGASTLDALTDVDTATVAPTNGQALVYDSAASLWKPSTITSSGNGFSILDQSESNSQITISGAPGAAVWSRTITAAPSGSYLVIAQYWIWSASGFGKMYFRKDGVEVAPQTDPGREGSPSERNLISLISHATGDLVLDLFCQWETGTIQFSTGVDSRFGRHVQIIGPLQAGGSTASEVDGGSP